MIVDAEHKAQGHDPHPPRLLSLYGLDWDSSVRRSEAIPSGNLVAVCRGTSIFWKGIKETPSEKRPMLRLGQAVLALVGLVFVCASLEAADFNLQVKTDDIKLGERLLGPALSSDDLKYRVVLLEFWGVNCGPCLAMMPKLASWNSEMSPHGLVVVGAHAQQATPDRIKTVALSRGANFTIVANARVEGANDFNTIPHCMIFDHTGACIYRGHPQEAEAIVRRAVAAAPPAVLEGRKLAKLGSLATQLKKEANFGQVLKQAQERAGSTDPAAAEEASFLVDKLTATAKKQLETAAELEESDPVSAWKLVNRVATNYKGTDLGKDAAETLAAMKGDKSFQLELKAFQTLDQVRNLNLQIRKVPGDDSNNSPAYRSANAPLLRQISNLVREMKKAAPDSKATQEAIEIAESAGVPIG
jgi:thiol-disulfide isomerase/thioredoxin